MSSVPWDPRSRGTKVQCPAPKPAYGRAIVNPESIGVTTSDHSMYEMSCMDRMLAQRYNPIWNKYGSYPAQPFESYQAPYGPTGFAASPYMNPVRRERFSFRTNYDKAQQDIFNKEYRTDRQVREEYDQLASQDPFMPYSYYTTNPSM